LSRWRGTRAARDDADQPRHDHRRYRSTAHGPHCSRAEVLWRQRGGPASRAAPPWRSWVRVTPRAPTWCH